MFYSWPGGLCAERARRERRTRGGGGEMAAGGRLGTPPARQRRGHRARGDRLRLRGRGGNEPCERLSAGFYTYSCMSISVSIYLCSFFDVRQQRIATPTARAPGGTYTITELTVDVRLCLLWGDVRLVITRRNGNSVRADRDGDGAETQLARTDPAKLLCSPGAGPAAGAVPWRGRSVGALR